MNIYIIITCLFILLYSCEFKDEHQEYAEMIIIKVEAFKKKKNRLPKDVSELGMVEEMESPAFYQLQKDSTYVVWYGLSLGESKVYRSSSKTWSEEG